MNSRNVADSDLHRLHDYDVRGVIYILTTTDIYGVINKFFA